MSHLNAGLSRRRFLRQSALGAATIGAVGAAGCSSGTTSSGSSASDKPPTPRHGGTLEVSVSDSSSSDKLNPIVLVDSHDIMSGALIYDTLTRIDLNFNVSPGLAVSWEPNADASVWRFKLRRGVTFHDGKPFTSEDVVWTLQQDVDPKGQATGLPEWLAILHPSGIKAVGPYEVQFTLLRPNYVLPQLLANFYVFIAQKGNTNWTKPPGTGPFVANEFQPGAFFYATRNPHYWDGNLPYLDGVRLVDVPDQSTKVQTVTSGTAQLGDTMEPSQIPLVLASPSAELLTAPGGYCTLIAWHGNTAPFNDPRVRKALKLLINREQIVKNVYLGHAQAGLDVVIPPSDPLYPHGMQPPPYDPDQAKFLLKQAGQENLSFDLWTSQVFPGFTEVPVFYKETAAAGGVTVNIQTASPQTYYSQDDQIKTVFMDAWLRQNTLALPPLVYTPGGIYDETRVEDPRIPKLFAEAAATNDLVVRKQKVADAIQLVQAESTNVVPCWTDFIWPKKKVLQGIQPSWSTLVTFTTAYLTT
jgi:peptide/nickel transport system substrate-binding protein